LDGYPHLLDLVGGVDDPESGHAVGQRDDFAGALGGCGAVVVGVFAGRALGDLAAQGFEHVLVGLRRGAFQDVGLDGLGGVVGEGSGGFGDGQRFAPGEGAAFQGGVSGAQCGGEA
jgi:hypothetical protein